MRLFARDHRSAVHPSPFGRLVPEAAITQWSWADALCLLLAVLVATGVYANSLANGWALDDVPIIAKNATVHGGQPWLDLLFTQYWPIMGRQGAVWRPVTIISFAIDWARTGGEPAGFHLVNVLLHGAVVALAYALVRTIGLSTRAALCGALLFAVHPLHVEAVSNVVGRGELLASLFVLLGLLLHQQRAWPMPLRVIGVAASYALALGAKEIGVCLPALLVLVDAVSNHESRRHVGHRRPATWTLPLRHGARAVWEALPTHLLCLGVLATYLLMRRTVLGDVHGSMIAANLVSLPTPDRVATAVRLWATDARLLAWPFHLSADYSEGAYDVTTWRNPAVWATLALTVGLVGAAWRSARATPWALAAFAWFAAAAFVVSNLAFPVGILLAERTLYLPSIALVFVPQALADLLQGVRAWRSRRRRTTSASRHGQRPALLVAGFVVVLIILGARTWLRTPIWRSTDAYAESVIRDAPTSYRALYYKGSWFALHGQPRAALPYFARAARLAPRDALVGMLYAKTLMLAGESVRADSVATANVQDTDLWAMTTLFDIRFAGHRLAGADSALAAMRAHFGAAPIVHHRAAQYALAIGDTATARRELAAAQDHSMIDSLRGLEQRLAHGDSTVVRRRSATEVQVILPRMTRVEPAPARADSVAPASVVGTPVEGTTPASFHARGRTPSFEARSRADTSQQSTTSPAVQAAPSSPPPVIPGPTP